MARWPVRLEDVLPDGARIVLRPLRGRDRDEWFQLREASAQWVRPWEPTLARPGQQALPWAAYLRHQRREARAGRMMPWVVEVDGRLCGAVTLSQVFEGALWGASVGYWTAQSHAGRGIAPMAVAMAGDHAMGERQLHRLEVNVRPDNERSLAVVRKLGLRDEGVRRAYLHIDGAWRDHRTFAVTTEDLQGRTLVERLREGRRTISSPTHPRG